MPLYIVYNFDDYWPMFQHSSKLATQGLSSPIIT